MKVNPLCWLETGVAAMARHNARHNARDASSCAAAQRVATACTPLSTPPAPGPALDRIRWTLTSRKFYTVNTNPM